MSYKIKFLVDRMNIDNINKLLEFTHNYPTTGQSVWDELVEKTSWVELTYGSIGVLNDVLKCGYHPHEIGELFNNQ